MSAPVSATALGTGSAIAIDLDALSVSPILDRFLRGSEAVRASGTAIIGYTDSRRCDVLQTFPGIRSRFDALIYEHGCVVEVEGRLFPMAPPVPQEVGLALRRTGVPALSGQVSITAPMSGIAAALASIACAMDIEVVGRADVAIIVPKGTTRENAIDFSLDRLGMPSAVVREVGSPASLSEALAATPIQATTRRSML